jgi:phosphotransferase system enzyme I (PtsP)
VAEWAVKKIIEKFAEQFAALSYLKERAGDLRTLGQRLLFHLDDSIQGPIPGRRALCWWRMNCRPPPGGSSAGSFGRRGGARWRRQLHAAIMVRALGIPTVMGADIQPSLLHGHTLIVDGYRGELLVDPEPVCCRNISALSAKRTSSAAWRRTILNALPS